MFSNLIGMRGAMRTSILAGIGALVLAAGTASAAYVITTDSGTNTSVDAQATAATAVTEATVADAQAASVVANVPLKPPEDPQELHARAEAAALLAAERAAAEEQARVEAEAAAIREAQEREAALAAERARIAEAEAQAARAAREEQTRVAAAAAAAAEAEAAAAAEAAPQAPVEAALTSATGSIQQAAAAAGWPGNQLAKVERVVMCESGGRTDAVAPAGYVGLMQVAPWLHGPVPADAVGQLAQAYQVYLQQGWGAWPVCGA